MLQPEPAQCVSGWTAFFPLGKPSSVLQKPTGKGVNPVSLTAATKADSKANRRIKTALFLWTFCREVLSTVVTSSRLGGVLTVLSAWKQTNSPLVNEASITADMHNYGAFSLIINADQHHSVSPHRSTRIVSSCSQVESRGQQLTRLTRLPPLLPFFLTQSLREG